MNSRQLLSKLRKCVTEFNMIKDGDKIAVGVSGGKDSLALLSLLSEYQKFSPQKFSLIAITVDLQFNGEKTDYSKIEDFCKELNVEYFIERTDIGKIVFDFRKEENPCSLCSKMRKGALYEIAKKHGANKVALGHHLDDLVQTFLMSLFFEGRLSTFAPKSYLSRRDIVMIRPMLYIEEADIISYSKNLPVTKSLCPANKHTKREDMKEYLSKLNKEFSGAKEMIYTALTHPERYNLFDKFYDQKDKF